MGQGGPGRGNGHFLPSPGTGRGEDAGHLASQRALDPETAGLVEEIAHLCGHVAEAGGRAEDDGIIVRQFPGEANGGSLSVLPPALRKASSGMVSGTPRMLAFTPETLPAPSATALAMVSIWPYIEW